MTCPTGVWEVSEGLPYLNRYDNYADNGQGTCVKTGFAIQDTTITSPTVVLTNSVNYVEAGLTVGQGGTLDMGSATVVMSGTTGPLWVAGTLDGNGATLTSPDAAPGSWVGLVFLPGSGGTLDHITVSYAGKSRYCGFGCGIAAGIYIAAASPTLTNSSIDHSAGNGLQIGCSNNVCGLPTLQNDTFTTNAGFAIAYDSAPADLSNVGGLRASGNGHDAIAMGYGLVTGTWPDTGLSLYLAASSGVLVQSGASITITIGTGTPSPVLPYIGTDLQVQAGGQATVLPGTTVQFDTTGHVDNSGTFTASGTAGQPITLTSVQQSPAPGDWYGLTFYAGSGGTLDHVHVSYAGRGRYCGFGCGISAGLYVAGASPTLTNSTIDTSGGNGLEVGCSNNVCGLPTLQNDTFTTNAGFAIAYDSAPADLSNVGGLRASGNGHDAIAMGYGVVTGTWPDTGLSLYLAPNNSTTLIQSGARITLTVGSGTPAPVLPYIGSGLQVQPGGQATIVPGTTVQFDTRGYIDIQGTLNAPGSAGQPITLTSSQLAPAPGDWYGLIYETGSGGTLDHVAVSFAGKSRYCGPGCSISAGVYIAGASPTLTNSTIDTSGGNDVEVGGGGRPVLHGDSFGAVPTGSFGVANGSGAPGPLVDASYNWWGDPTGPAGVGPGAGVPVSAGVYFSPWFTGPPS